MQPRAEKFVDEIEGEAYLTLELHEPAISRSAAHFNFLLEFGKAVCDNSCGGFPLALRNLNHPHCCFLRRQKTHSRSLQRLQGQRAQVITIIAFFAALHPVHACLAICRGGLVFIEQGASTTTALCRIQRYPWPAIPDWMKIYVRYFAAAGHVEQKCCSCLTSRIGPCLQRHSHLVEAPGASKSRTIMLQRQKETIAGPKDFVHEATAGRASLIQIQSESSNPIGNGSDESTGGEMLFDGEEEAAEALPPPMRYKPPGPLGRWVCRHEL
mmetsp:Transcript_57338/g.101691  ORF Transcript_57338/g.101691 Transcript_57338/m.101691 type:complete len:269 (+) Transcript_57338:4083-4889(+)